MCQGIFNIQAVRTDVDIALRFPKKHYQSTEPGRYQVVQRKLWPEVVLVGFGLCGSIIVAISLFVSMQSKSMVC